MAGENVSNILLGDGTSSLLLGDGSSVLLLGGECQTAFQESAFQDDAFQICEGAVVTPVVTGISGGGRYRYFTPTPPPLHGRMKKRIDEVIEKEARIKEAIADYQDSGTDILIIEDLLRQLKELQLTILRLALESALVTQYIDWKRKQEDEDIAFILSIL